MRKKRSLHYYSRGPEIDKWVAKRQIAKPRTCLRCEDMFDSSSAGNRLCPGCLGTVTRKAAQAMV